ncbi:MAG TPA: PadR family transcriptional regulator [Steroidobacteraceae bacterium]|nr:PadR family transcriptional regulator [Steroidobacteraceae bacterium]
MHHLRYFLGRQPGGRGLGHFGKGFTGGGDWGGRPFGMGRKLASVDLQLLILGLLAEKPRHGYEIIKALDERSKGFYVPSPGMVYPALTYLEEIGHATLEAVGTRKLYRITAAGTEHLDNHRSTLDALFAQFRRVGERMDQVRRAMHAEEAAGGFAEERRGSKELQRARCDLSAALAGKRGSSLEEQQRIAEILKLAAAQILRQTDPGPGATGGE